MVERQDITKLLQGHQAIKHFDYDIAIDWALHLVEQGIETENILILASFSKPADSFEIKPYLKQALEEQNLTELNEDSAVDAKAHYHLAEILNNLAVRRNLRELQTLCIDNNYRRDLMPFYLLYHGWIELEEMGINLYYEEADMNNIEDILRRDAKKWIEEHVVSE
jgi:hypothetical protein